MAKIKDLPKFKRPREKLFEKGPEALGNYELLAILLRTGYQGKSALEVAKRILTEITIDELAKLPLSKIAQLKGVGKSRAATITAAFSLGKRLNSKMNNSISSPEDVYKLAVEYKNKKKEYLIGIYLDARRQLCQAGELLGIGLIDHLIITPDDYFSFKDHHLIA